MGDASFLKRKVDGSIVMSSYLGPGETRIDGENPESGASPEYEAPAAPAGGGSGIGELAFYPQADYHFGFPPSSPDGVTDRIVEPSPFTMYLKPLRLGKTTTIDGFTIMLGSATPGDANAAFGLAFYDADPDTKLPKNLVSHFIDNYSLSGVVSVSAGVPAITLEAGLYWVAFTTTGEAGLGALTYKANADYDPLIPIEAFDQGSPGACEPTTDWAPEYNTFPAVYPAAGVTPAYIGPRYGAFPAIAFYAIAPV